MTARATRSLGEFVQRWPLVSFLILTLCFSWWPSILYRMDVFSLPIIGVGPFLAAVVVLAITVGKPGVVSLLRSMVRWRVKWYWYAFALLAPVGITALATALNVLLGAQRPTADELAGWPEVPIVFLLLLLIPGIGGAWEEPGFRGYLLPKLQKRISSLNASLVIGILHVTWHLPLFLTGNIEWPDVPLIIAVAIVLTWVFNSARGSVLIVMILHAMNNAISGEFFAPMFTGQDSVNQALLLALLWGTLALGLVVVLGPSLRTDMQVPKIEPEVPPIAGERAHP